MDLLKLARDQKGKVLPLQQALDYVAQIIDVLDEMHSEKLVYRNVRP
jgi:serine/threonine protein kinase